MKKFIIIFMLALCLPFIGSAQEFQKGSKVISLGLGLGSSVGHDLTYGSQIPTISAQYEQGVWDIGGPGVISLGGYIGFKSYSNNADIGKSKWNYTLVGVRSAYHFNMLEVDNLDLYAGAMLGFYFENYSGPSGSTYNANNSVGLSLYAGGRYYFSDNFGGFAEVGYGVSYLTVGVAFKLQ
ncbi:hypothetical protein [Algoriphagus chordae]|uniref:Outer membrane protein with beta-barrel domain n=1 Tax=Algoriphagus chordae TaxID=237019 RepID=A0A2W7QRI5_9BACT|nr:hypothetical protein [Algoriphagus chordae]PZX46447.1 hypothetical protein LV85_04254 [Algoriphagus chordae]